MVSAQKEGNATQGYGHSKPRTGKVALCPAPGCKRKCPSAYDECGAFMLHLQSLDDGTELDVRSALVHLGRVPGLPITSTRFSRDHLTARLSDGGDRVEVEARKRAWIQPAAADGPTCLHGGDRAALGIGDSLFLEKLADGSLASGFVVKPGGAAAAPMPGSHAATATAARPSQAGRGAAAPQHQQLKPLSCQPVQGVQPMMRAPGASASGSHPKRPIRPAPTTLTWSLAGPSQPPAGVYQAASAKPASARPAPKPAPPGPGSQTVGPGLFDGVTACFWTRAHVKVLQRLLLQHGAVVQGSAGPQTTHVVLEHDVLSVQQAAARLERERGQRPSAAAAQGSLVPFAARNASKAVRGLSPTPPSPPHAAVLFIIPEYFSACLQKGCRLPEERFGTKFRPPELDEGEGPERPAHAASSSLSPASSPAHAPPPAAAQAAAPSSAHEPPADPALVLHAEAVAEPARGDAGHPDAPLSPSADVPAPALTAPPSPSASALAAAAAPAPAAAPSGASPAPEIVAPTADDICTSADDWGVGGRWIEPWDDALARDTLQKLHLIWQPLKRSVAAAAQPDPRPCLDLELRSDETPVSERGGRSPGGRAAAKQVRAGAGPAAACGTLNELCRHVACSAQPYCFISELERVVRNYLPQEVFKKKAITKAIAAILELREPIRDQADVHRLLAGVGERTKDKVGEIMEGGGKYWRNAVREANERLRTIGEFVEIWGAGPVTAEEWYRRGCRTLEDVAAQTDLNAMQRIGVKHHLDFGVKVPRAEVAECAALCRQCFLEVLRDVTGLAAEALEYRLPVRAAGSYMRGRLDIRDIDIVICPSPAAYSVPGAEDMLHPQRLKGLLVEKMVARGWITDHVDDSGRSAAAPKQLSSRGATFMGVWRGPSSPVARRIDIKLYPLKALPFALNYFSSSTNFSRAIRHYGKWGVTRESLAAQGVLGEHFHLTDAELLPVVTVGGEEVVSGPPVPARWETDLFHALGLHYVPPHMRNVKW